MSKNISEYQRYINTAAADTEVVKVVLSALIAKLAEGGRTQIIDDLHELTKIAVQRGATGQSDGQLAQRMHQLKLSGVEEYFRKLRAIVGSAETRKGGPMN